MRDRHARIRRGQAVFGPTLDGLVREVDGRVPPEARAAHIAMLEEWPLSPEGEAQDADLRLARLSALAEAPEPMPPGLRPGAPWKAVLGFVLGVTAGWPAGFLVYMFAREFLLADAARESETVMWLIPAASALAAGVLAARQGLRPSRLGHALARALLGFFLGGLGFAFLAGAVAVALAGMLGISQAEGAYAMGVVFAIMPFAGVLGGLGCAAWAGWRAWRVTSTPRG